LHINSTLHQEVRDPPSPGQRNMISYPVSPLLDDRDERNATQRDNEGHVRQLGVRAGGTTGYRSRKGSLMAVSGGGMPNMMTGGRYGRRPQKAKELMASFEDMEAEEVPTRAAKKGKGQLPSLVPDPQPSGGKANQAAGEYPPARGSTMQEQNDDYFPNEKPARGPRRK